MGGNSTVLLGCPWLDLSAKIRILQGERRKQAGTIVVGGRTVVEEEALEKYEELNSNMREIEEERRCNEQHSDDED